MSIARPGTTAMLLLLATGPASEAKPVHHKHQLVAPAPAQAPAPHTENLTVHGQKRFVSAPMPDQEIHDPSDALRDPNTGSPIGRFGGAYNDANPVPPVNPGLSGGQDPVDVGVPR